VDTAFDIFEAIGVGAAAGLSPLVAIATVILLVAVHLGVNPEGSDADFAAGVAAVSVAVIVLLQSFALVLSPGGNRLRVAADRPRFNPVLLIAAVALGGAGGAIVFSAEGHTALVGALIGAASASLVAPAAGGLLSGVHDRLEKRSKQEGEPGSARILSFGTDVLAIAAVAVSLAAPPLGLALPIMAILLLIGARRRAERKHEGLRVLR
jgi:hypothetical protein